MGEKILFSLEKCMKCTQTKELLADRADIKIVTFPHDINDWNDEELNDAKAHDVFEDLQRTAPILWVDGEKIVGYLRIRKWLQDEQNR
jgi:glutaredoxin